MADPAVQRQYPRYDLQLPFLHQPVSPRPVRTGVGWTRNLSEGGACVELAERLLPPAPVRIRLQTDRGTIEVEAQVVWDAEAKGGGVLHGLAFTYLTAENLGALRALLLNQAQERRRASARVPVHLPVTCQPRVPNEPPMQGWTDDVSRGGLLLRLDLALPPGTALDLTIFPPTGPVTAQAEIVWVDPAERRISDRPIRHGVRFTALGWFGALSLGLTLTVAPGEPSPPWVRVYPEAHIDPAHPDGA